MHTHYTLDQEVRRDLSKEDPGSKEKAQLDETSTFINPAIA